MAQVAQGENANYKLMHRKPRVYTLVEELNEADADLAEALRNCHEQRLQRKKVSLCLSEPSVIFRI